MKDVFGDSDENEAPAPVKSAKTVSQPLSESNFEPAVVPEKKPKKEPRIEPLFGFDSEPKKSRKRRDSGRENGPQPHCHGPKVTIS